MLTQVQLTVNLVVETRGNIPIEEVINELSYNFVDTTEEATIQDMEIADFEVV